MGPVLTADNLGRRFGPRWLFRALDLDLQSGQCLCILGHNGSGKSTLLKVLAGLVEPSEGKVTRPGRNGIGYAALDLSLYPQLTALEHLTLFSKFRGVPDPGEEALQSVGLVEVAGKPVGVYSTGMRVRLKLALATFHRPEVLFLDEPTAALDVAGQEVVGQVVANHVQHGAVLIATNDAADRRWATHELQLGT